MRLIREEDVIEMLTNVELSCTSIPMLEAKTRLRDIPTAYDVDEVVEQLEEKIINTADTQIGISARMAFGKAIEIVKAGGINE